MIFYLCPDHPEPSWGVGMLYEHVALLRRLGWSASILHHQRPFRPDWRLLEEPVVYLDDPGFVLRRDDLVVVPEVLAAAPSTLAVRARRIVFVQGSFLIVSGLRGHEDYPALGYEAAMAVLPHVARVVERHFGLAATVVPPFVAAEFTGSDGSPRLRRILLASKPAYAKAGLPDEPIVTALLERELRRRPSWSLRKLEGLSHAEVARLMRTSELLVNVNSLEAFNTTVPEAMAAGCVPICYEAVGGRDFLHDGENALVLADHDVYGVVERVCDLIDRFEDSAPALDRLRIGGAATAARYCPEATGRALDRFFVDLLGRRS